VFSSVECWYFQTTCLLGLVLTIVSCAAMWFLSAQSAIYVLLPAVLLGSGGCILLVTSLSMTADLIGKHTVRTMFPQPRSYINIRLSRKSSRLLHHNPLQVVSLNCLILGLWGEYGTNWSVNLMREL